MSGFIHNYWQYIFVVICVVLLGLEIPRKAIFFKPLPEQTVSPFASYVTFDENTYAELMKRIQVSWKVRQGTIAGRVTDIGGDIEALVLAQDKYPFEFLPMNEFLPRSTDFLPRNKLIIPHRSFKPKSLASAAAKEFASAVDFKDERSDDKLNMRRSMIEIPDSLKD